MRAVRVTLLLSSHCIPFVIPSIISLGHSGLSPSSRCRIKLLSCGRETIPIAHRTRSALGGIVNSVIPPCRIHRSTNQACLGRCGQMRAEDARWRNVAIGRR